MFIYLWFSFIAMLQHSLTVNFSAELNFSVFEPTLWIGQHFGLEFYHF